MTVDLVGREDLERARKRRLGQRMGVDAENSGPIDARSAPLLADRLADGQDVRLVEGVVEGRAAMPRGAEGDRCDGTLGSGLPVK